MADTFTAIKLVIFVAYLRAEHSGRIVLKCKPLRGYSLSFHVQVAHRHQNLINEKPHPSEKDGVYASLAIVLRIDLLRRGAWRWKGVAELHRS